MSRMKNIFEGVTTLLTPKEISEKTFDRTFGFGYRMDDVEEYLKTVSAALQEQIDKNQDLERKLEVLADKLTEYREDEESLRTALLGAQKLGDSVIRESKTKAEIILRDANIKAETIVSNAKRQIDREQEAFEKIQNEVASFKDRLLDLYKQHLELVSTIPGKNATPRDAAAAAEKAIDESPEEERDAGQPLSEKSEVSEKEEISVSEQALAEISEKEKAMLDEEFDDEFDDDDEPAFSSSKFGELRFGDAFRIEHKK